MARYQWFIESTGPAEWNPRNLLVSSAVSQDPDVLAALESALRHGFAGAPQDSACFIGFGTSENGEWLDPPPGFIDGLADLPVILEPVSAAGLNPIPPPRGCRVSVVEQPNMPRLLCTVKLRKWEPGVVAVVYINVGIHEHESVRRAGSTAHLRKVDGVWVVDDWKGSRAWSPD
jgi:hypothetical protein